MVNNSISWTVTDIMAWNEETITTDLLITAPKSWTQIATKLKSIPKMYSQKFCTLIFLEGRFLIIAYIFQKMKHVTLLKKFFVSVPIKCIIPKLYEEKKCIIAKIRNRCTVNLLLYIHQQNHLKEPSPATKNKRIITFSRLSFM